MAGRIARAPLARVVNRKDAFNRTPLYYAVVKGDRDVARALLEAGACTGVGKWTLLHQAIVHEDCDMLEVLLRHGQASPEAKSSALELARKFGTRRMTALLAPDIFSDEK
jgi:ankyrin repeat protein